MGVLWLLVGLVIGATLGALVMGVLQLRHGRSGVDHDD